MSPPPTPPPPPPRSIDRFSTVRACDLCRRRKRRCNGQKPCLSCKPNECVYSVGSDRGSRRLSSGSACETCRRRKTKCDGGHPCAYCATNQLNCVNHAERTRTVATPEAMDRIEDRLRRIEHLMTVFTPVDRLPPHFVRPQRHSVQGIAVAKELQLARRAISSSPDRHHAYITPPNSGGKKKNAPTMSRQLSNPSQPLTSYMLDLTLSPSSSSSMHLPQSSLSTPQLIHHTSVSNQVPSMPSLMDQLSTRTFISSHSDYPVRNSYPIYPLSPSPPVPPTTTFAEASFSP